MTVRHGGYLSSKDCYIGQVVYWVMWVDEEDANWRRERGDPQKGWYGYRRGLSPILWSGRVIALPRNGAIMLEHFGRASCVSKCEIDAVAMECKSFCRWHLCGFPRSEGIICDIREAARVLGLMADLEDGLHRAHAMNNTKEVVHGR
jgi:hypothetical protein